MKYQEYGRCGTMTQFRLVNNCPALKGIWELTLLWKLTICTCEEKSKNAWANRPTTCTIYPFSFVCCFVASRGLITKLAISFFMAYNFVCDWFFIAWYIYEEMGRRVMTNKWRANMQSAKSVLLRSKAFGYHFQRLFWKYVT